MNLIGTMLAGRYEILEEVGKGGMAYVYKARCHFLNRLVAIKVLKEELSDDKEFVHRFNTEAQAAARISNPHVVSIYDVGFENGLYYIVMEYVDGITLKEYIESKGVIPWKKAAEFAAQICEGLSAAHKKAVIHRDIKPQNIIMTGGEVLKVTDFGIARATSQATTTTSNSTIGTVHYLSPEQARGGYTNERTDIYSLGVVLYEMLTGRLPFNDNTAVAIAIKHIQEKPVLPRILNNEIPEAMEYIVMKALNKEQNLRYASADDFLADLKKVIKNPNVVLVAVNGEDDLDRTVKRSAIDDKDIDNYERQRRKENPEYGRYAEQVDREVEENRRRNVDRMRAVKEQKKKERRITVAAVAAAIIVLVGMGFAFSMITGGNPISVFTGGEKIEIPNVMDMVLLDAQKQYRQDGFSIIKKTEKTSDKPAGTILEQDPPAGSTVSKKDDIVISVVVSAGANKVRVDNFVNMKAEDARKLISERKLKVNEVSEESDTVAEGTVIRQEPASGQEVSEGYLVTLYVSSGKKKDDKKDESENKKTDTYKKDDSSSGSKPSNNSNNSGTSSNSGSSSSNSGSNTNSGSSSSSSSNNSGSSSSSSSSNSGSSSSSNSSGSSSSSTGGSSNSGSSSTSSDSSGEESVPGISN